MLVPDPISLGAGEQAVTNPYSVVAPYSNSHEVTWTPCALTLPVTVALVSAAFETGPVLTSGTTSRENTFTARASLSATYSSPDASTARPTGLLVEGGWSWARKAPVASNSSTTLASLSATNSAPELWSTATALGFANGPLVGAVGGAPESCLMNVPK